MALFRNGPLPGPLCRLAQQQPTTDCPRHPRVKRQAIFAAVLSRAVFPPRLIELLRRRVFIHYGINDIDFARVRQQLLKIPKSWALICLRSYLGGWIANRRMQRDAPCIYGCQDPPDTARPYVSN
eukprot:9480691-Pyramimonas_sp.AAC.1